jgi:hypothetical protein
LSLAHVLPPSMYTIVCAETGTPTYNTIYTVTGTGGSNTMTLTEPASGYDRFSVLLSFRASARGFFVFFPGIYNCTCFRAEPLTKILH